MSTLSPLLPALIPVLPLLAGLLCRGRAPETAGRIALLAASLSALSAAGFAVLHGVAEISSGALLKFDGVSSVMVVLVSFLGAVVLRFSRNYLAGDPHQARFFSWMSLTLAAVITLVLSGHLLLLLGAWVATSLCLHRLLLHHPERAGAIFSARKKFVFSRLGDVCLAAAIVILFWSHGTLELDGLFASIAAGNSGGLPAAGYLIVSCAALKSAQFPFHSWLPDTMETPTPVSAFMHAGIINAGGFLIVRLSPLFTHAPGALNALAILGTLTAAFGAVVMLAQPGVKRALAYSTIAQMGFMMVQCGLGAYGLALLHIVAHSLYKANAFLTSGSSVGAVPRAAVRLCLPALALGLPAGGLLAVGGATIMHALLPSAPHAPVVFVMILALALAYGIARAVSADRGAGTILSALVFAAGIALAGLGLHAGAETLFARLPGVTPPLPLLVFVGAVFAGLFVFQSLMWRIGDRPAGRGIYVHALNGFYFGTFANRLLSRLWPRHSSN